ncbi:MAG: mechanosensitive ion channel [Acidobacteria bacterium]|nr:mechanosensitive ion channel [Acidobacteriota bacterium]NIM60339.1 mechanosensitive ion channel [Acidobacteriota bacterium]NIO60340.1 mechanosensitive ion channel [Acidobacteriota bacterium]NIQ31395.1 mechanosensitive ion channel [Acidobacteriota bacterium]NIQ86621.1 mechanosensitive ion channel [Acidobacteriota bacterium]
MLEFLISLIPSTATIVVVVCVLWAANLVLQKHATKHIGVKFRNQMIMVGLTFAGVLAIILVLPMDDARRGQLLSLLGLLLSAAIALSSTTILGNAMAGLMLRAVRSFRTGDFIRCGDHFGRVTERGLVHTEIQNEDRRLTTLPNLYLVTHPFTRIRASGTIIATSVSLGYDVPRTRVEPLLLQAAERSGLSGGFVQIKELGDFSVSYRVAGMLTEVKQIITAGSRLRAAVLDALHDAGVEIVSPNFMNQRVLPDGFRAIPAAAPRRARQAVDGSTVEEIVFDKAEEAETIEALLQRRAGVVEQIDELAARCKKVDDEADKKRLEGELNRLQSTADTLKRVIELRQQRSSED